MIGIIGAMEEEVAALKAGVVIELLKEPGLRGAGRERKEDEERQKRRLWQMRCK